MRVNPARATHRSSPPRFQLALIVIPVLSTIFGAISGTTIGQPLLLAACGLLWDTIAMLVAPLLAQRGAQSVALANAPVYVMLPLACIVLGGSILGHLVGPTPTAFLQLLQHPGYGLFFYAVHAPFEWLLLPWALMVNWSYPNRRRLLVAAAVVFYLGRAVSALYFAPAALAWGRQPAAAAAQLDQVAQWMRLDLIRVVVQDTVTAALLVLAALHSRFRLETSYSVRETRET